MKYYLSKASLLRKRSWRFLPWKEDIQYPYPKNGNRYVINDKNIEEIVRFASLLIHKGELDLIVAESHNGQSKYYNRIYIDGGLNKNGQAVVHVSLVCGTTEYLIGVYGGNAEDLAYYESRKGKCLYGLSNRNLGSNYPLV